MNSVARSVNYVQKVAEKDLLKRGRRNRIENVYMCDFQDRTIWTLRTIKNPTIDLFVCMQFIRYQIINWRPSSQVLPSRRLLWSVAA